MTSINPKHPRVALVWTRARTLQGVRMVFLWSLSTVAMAATNSLPTKSQERPAAAPPGSEVSSFKRLTLEELMSLEVTSVSRRRERLSASPSAIQVVGAEDIRRSGALTLPATMRLAGNLNVAQKNAHDWGISARGFNTSLANKMLVMIDGRAVYTPLFSGVFWNAQDAFLEDLERIEVISGPGGSVWGANAVNGVISVVTKHAGKTPGLFLEAGIGSKIRKSAAVRFGGEVGDAHYRVYGKHLDIADEKLAVGEDAGDSWDRTSLGFRVDGEVGERSRWTAQGDVYRGEDGLVAGGRARLEGGHLLGRWTHRLPSTSELTYRGYYDWTRLDLPVPEFTINGLILAPSGTLRDRLETYDIEGIARIRPRGRHQFTSGLGFRLWRDRVENAPSLGFLPADQDHRVWSGFLQDEISLGPRARVTVGTKIEYNDYTGVEVEPSLRLLVAVDDRCTVWTALSRAVRTPSRIDRELSQPVAPYLVVLAGSDDFESESVIAMELGFRSQIGKVATASVATFYNDYQDIRSTSTTPGTILPLSFANNVEGETYGVEITSTFQVSSSWRLHFGYTLLEEDLRVRKGEEDINAALNEIADPQQQLMLRTSLDVTDTLSVDAALRWIDSLRINRGSVVGTVPSYTELDLRLAWQVSPSLEVSLVGQNLLQDSHPEYGFPDADRVEVSRSVAGKLTWRR